MKCFEKTAITAVVVLAGMMAFAQAEDRAEFPPQDPKRPAFVNDITLPYEGCKNGRIEVQWGDPHAYPNYPAMGVPFAAFLQYWREK